MTVIFSYANGMTPRLFLPLISLAYVATQNSFAGSWQEVPGAEGISSHSINSMAAIADNDVWAVGEQFSQTKWSVLVEHWDGSQWSVIEAPSPSKSSDLFGVAALASNDVWAVGITGGAGSVSLVEHWDGTAWDIVPSPSVSGADTETWLTAVKPISPTDIWAVGYWFGPASDYEHRTFAIHWNGRRWSIVPTPTVGEDSLMGISGTSRNDVWAVGYTEITTSESNTLTLHWDGTVWTVVPSPNLDSDGSSLLGVAAIASNNVWAVGYSDYISVGKSYAIHWDGSSWTAFPPPQNSGDYLEGVVALSPTKLMAVGGHDGTPLTVMWNGTAWQNVRVPAVSVDVGLTSVAITPTRTLWAGGPGISNESDSLFLRKTQ